MATHFIELPDGQLPDFITLLRGIRDGSAIGSPDSAEAIKVKYESNINTNAFTDAEKAKLAVLEDSHFKGIYIDLTSLQTAYPTAVAGDYAYVDNLTTLIYYTWDVGTLAWTITSNPASLTASEVKSLYESNPDTNVLNDAGLALLSQNATDIVALKSPVSTKYAPQSAEPTHQAGQIWYDANYNVMATQTDIAGLKIHVPTDSIIRIINRTGATIPAMTAVRNGGADATTNIIKGVQAQADSIFTSFVIGVTPKDILPDAQGWVISDGHIHNVDTSSLVTGSTLFLSDTVAGGIVQANPKIASALGTVLRSDATVGQVFVKIDNLIQYPQATGYLRGQVNPTYSLTTTAQPVVGYSTEDSVIMVTDALNGKITMPLEGMFSVGTAMSLSFASSASTRTVYVELYNATDAVVEGTYPKSIPRDATEDGASFPAMFTGLAGKEYQLRIKSSVAMNISIDNVSFSITSNYIG